MRNDPSSTSRTDTDPAPAGRLEARYLAFIETISHARPKLHRYCARMTGSALDGEDVVQEALFQAYRKLESFDDARAMEPWLFRIAHNRCVDLLRQRESRGRAEAEAAAEESEFASPIEPVGQALGTAVEHLVLVLPPKERACVLLKDVFDYTLEEIAEFVDSTVGGVKAALHRGREKLAEKPVGPAPARVHGPEDTALLRLYVERFNQRDWVGIRELVSSDARLQVVDRFAGRLMESPYFGTYERLPAPVRMAVGALDGEKVAVVEQQAGEGWTPRAVARLEVADGRVVRVTDYWFCPWIVSAAASLVMENV